jgi:DivIVA domain-containing protein
VRSDDIVKARFTKVFRGYDVQEVDLFLDEVIRTLDEMEQERNLLLSRMEALLAQLDEYDALLQSGNGQKANQ